MHVESSMYIDGWLGDLRGLKMGLIGMDLQCQNDKLSNEIVNYLLGPLFPLSAAPVVKHYFHPKT